LLRSPARILADQLTRLGERHSIDWLVYNPMRMLVFHRLASVDADAVARAVIAVFPDARIAADVGSGTGALAAAMRRQGLNVQGCERSRVGRLISRGLRVPTVAFDLNRYPPATIEGPVDVAYCIEVAEHLAPELGDRLVAFLCGLAPAVVFTAASPGQGGDGHVNEQPPSYWQERFASHGYLVNGPATDRLVSQMATIRAWYIPRNLSVFSRAWPAVVGPAGELRPLPPVG